MKDTSLSIVYLPKECSYIGVFLTLACNYQCSYCINHHGEFKHRRTMSTEEWIRGLSRLVTRPDLPLTLQGGEPTIHPGFYEIISAISGQYLDLLTNFSVDTGVWFRRLSPRDFYRPAKYPSIRVSYHPGQSPILELFWGVFRATQRGYPIGIWAVDHPGYRLRNRVLKKVAKVLGIVFRYKEFLGWYQDSLYGEFKYPTAVYQKVGKVCECKSWELLIGPDGYIHRCHADLYANRNPIGHILDEKLPQLGVWRPCSHYGQCNECDVKIKTSRHQVYGACSVEIRDIARKDDTA